MALKCYWTRKGGLGENLMLCKYCAAVKKKPKLQGSNTELTTTRDSEFQVTRRKAVDQTEGELTLKWSDNHPVFTVISCSYFSLRAPPSRTYSTCSQTGMRSTFRKKFPSRNSKLEKLYSKQILSHFHSWTQHNSGNWLMFRILKDAVTLLALTNNQRYLISQKISTAIVINNNNNNY